MADHPAGPTFSIPGRIELSATTRGLTSGECINSFSIPGRIELSATARLPIGAGGSSAFQYPRSDRVVCNPLALAPISSSVRAFSIPGRIELSATRPLRGRSPSYPIPFSIPGRIELSATSAGLIAARLVFVFQYPRSDRVVCNGHVGSDGSTPAGPFSIPGRIELSATGSGLNVLAVQDKLSVSPVGSSCLQLWSDSSRPISCSGLSVSPVGSSCLQLYPNGRGEINHAILSVSPVGSSCLQRRSPLSHRSAQQSFQYPRSDRVVCNMSAKWYAIRSRILSVSPVGSSCLQLRSGGKHGDFD